MIDELFSPTFVGHTPLPGVPPTREGVRALFAGLHAAFPDLIVTIHEQVAEGDKVVTHKTLAGSHEGPFLGVPATGRRIAFDVIDLITVADGKLAAHRALVDQLGLLRQLGVIPS